MYYVLVLSTVDKVTKAMVNGWAVVNVMIVIYDMSLEGTTAGNTRQ